MPFSESAILDLNSFTFKGMHLTKLGNRQVVFAGLWTPQQPLWGPGEFPSLAGLLALLCAFFSSLNLSII